MAFDFTTSVLARLKTRIIRKLFKRLRPSSQQYISGDGYRRLAGHIRDETMLSFNPKKVKDGDVIFMPTHFAAQFFEALEPRIEAQYILITHNSDYPVDERMSSKAGPKVIKWFAQNNTFSNPKIVPVPIGLENLHHYNLGIPKYYDSLRGVNCQKQNRILYGFSIETNPQERQLAYQYASRCPYANGLTTKLSQKEYLELLTTYKFVLSPPGNGLDTHRTWEAIYLGVTPIVKDSVAMRSFEQLGLPVWIIQDWSELLSYDEDFLAEKYNQIKDKFNSSPLFMQYWKNRILDTACNKL